jgi:hypothetical protein
MHNRFINYSAQYAIIMIVDAQAPDCDHALLLPTGGGGDV